MSSLADTRGTAVCRELGLIARLNDRIGDVTCKAVAGLPQARSDAASAKYEKRMAGKSA